MSHNSPIDLVHLFTEELKLCKLQADEVMAVLTGPHSRSDYAMAFMRAGRALGAEVLRLDLPETPATLDGTGVAANRSLLTGHRSALETLKRADLVIDLLGLLHSPEQVEIQRAGARVLMVAEPPDILARMFPRPGQRSRVEAGARRLAGARKVRFTNAAGTDMRYTLGQYTPIDQYGYTDQAGRWDNFPGSFVYTWPNEGQSEGVIVLQEGDILLPFKEFVRSEVRIEVENGFITSVTGGFDAWHMRQYLESWNDPAAYAMAHIGWGLDESAQWHAMTMVNKQTSVGQDARAYCGNVLWSTGPNTDVGGSRNTPAHLDIAMRDASLYLDDEPVLVDGRLVTNDMAVA